MGTYVSRYHKRRHAAAEGGHEGCIPGPRVDGAPDGANLPAPEIR